MSFEAHRILFATEAARLDKIRLLVSPADTTTGIIDDSTVCDKAYMENVGEATNTGTIAAAVIDLYGMLTGGESGSLIIVGANKLLVSDNGVACGTTVTGGYDLETGANPDAFGGNVTIAGTLDVTGLTTLDGGLTVPAGESALLGDLDINFTDAVHTPTLGQTRGWLDMDTSGNFIMANPFSDAEVATINDANDISGCLQLNGNGHDEKFIFKTTGYDSTLVIGDDLKNTANFITSNLVYPDVPGVSVMHNRSDITGPHLTLVNSEVGGAPFIRMITEGGVGWTIQRSGGAADTLTFFHNDGSSYDGIFELERDLVWVRGSQGDAHFLISGTDSGGVPSQYLRLVPAEASETNRDNGSPSNFRTLMKMAWRTTGYEASIGMDGFYEYDSFRIYFSDPSAGSSEPNVAIGKPLGTPSAPIDALNVMDSPFLVAVNADHRWLAANHGSKEGLWVGAGDGSSAENAARIWLQNRTGSPAIQWGTTGIGWPVSTFVSDGRMKMTADTTPNNFGTASALGYIAIDVWTSTSAFAAATTIEAELQASVLEIKAGTSVIVEDSLGARELWTVSPDESVWCRLPYSGGTVAVS